MQETLFLKLFASLPDYFLAGVVLLLTYHYNQRADNKDKIIQDTHLMCETKLSTIADRAIAAVEKNTVIHEQVLDKIDELNKNIIDLRLITK